MSKDEIFEIVDENDNIIGTARRSECHGNPALIHRTSHVVVFNSKGEILLQKRNKLKDIQPGKWDTAVGGHLDVGETYEQGARREMNEELGISHDLHLEFLFNLKIRNNIESENVRVFKTVYDGEFNFQKEEIDEVKFWTIEQLLDCNNHQDFTPNLVFEIGKLAEIIKK
ncbi:NUDIX domain-containing protein [Lentisphaerota bacterium WC36G]|nr:NUDIX domain-containing protein [Lentisphaerae bacterium WC36]